MPKNEKPTYDVFVSYRWAEPDQTWVRDFLVPALRSSGLRVCLDVDDFVPGRDLILEMTRAGTDSTYALAVVSPEYLDGNRMVAFESLMARRSDPGAIEGRLIPLLFKPCKLPEWLRGLIPVDWTDEKRREDEWRKLLKALGAPNESCPPPKDIEGESLQSPQTIHHKPASASIGIRNLTTLTPRTGSGVGFSLEVFNKSDRTVRISSTLITGRVAKIKLGAAPAHFELAFYVELDSLVDLSSFKVQEVTGLVFDSPEDEWGGACEGRFEYEDSTARGRELWRYHFSTPTKIKIEPMSELQFRVLFKRRKRQQILSFSKGSTPAAYIGDFMFREHEFSLVLEDGSHVSHPIGDEFLYLIANWHEK